MDRLYPGDPGYEEALAAMLVKAKRINPRFRLATPEERAYGDPRDLYSFAGADGKVVAPVFVLDMTEAHPPCPTCAGHTDCDGLHD